MASVRRLAAIMFTDMVGSTAAAQVTEAEALQLRDEQEAMLRPLFSTHQGRDVKSIGDGFFVEFASAMDAVRCAYDIQEEIRELNLSGAKDERIHLRVGIHPGDVIESRGDILGDAVSVASRIERFARDGGISLTQPVFEQVRNKFELSIQSLGKKHLKHVSETVEVYRVVLPRERTHRRARPKTKLSARPAAWRIPIQKSPGRSSQTACFELSTRAHEIWLTPGPTSATRGSSRGLRKLVGGNQWRGRGVPPLRSGRRTV
jgi:class 3 adenylate cyclase